MADPPTKTAKQLYSHQSSITKQILSGHLHVSIFTFYYLYTVNDLTIKTIMRIHIGLLISCKCQENQCNEVFNKKPQFKSFINIL